MKKVISIVCVLCVVSMVACRNGTEEYDPLVVDHGSATFLDSSRYDPASDASGGGKDQEPPRKDLLQWGGSRNKGQVDFAQP